MKKVCIFLFSGTGMTRYVVDKITHELENLQVKVDVYPIEKTQIQGVSLDAYDAVGIAYPVHAFNAPKIVIGFARQLPMVLSTNVFLINTAGENHPLNYSSSRLLLKILREKKCHVFYDKQLYMPSNFTIKYDAPKVEQLIAAVNAEIPQIAHDIATSASYKRDSGFLSKCMACIGRAEWFGAIFIGKMFYADKNAVIAESAPTAVLITTLLTGIAYILNGTVVYVCVACIYALNTQLKFISLLSLSVLMSGIRTKNYWWEEKINAKLHLSAGCIISFWCLTHKWV